MWAIGIVLVLLAGLGVGGWAMFRGEPEWYQPEALSESDRTVAARRAEDKLVELRNSYQELRAKTAAGSATKPITFSITQAELTSAVDKWTRYDLEKSGNAVIRPEIVLREGQIILAARVAEIGTVVSLRLAPRLDAKGELELNLTGIYAGKLPMPESLMKKYDRMISDAVGMSLPQMQEQAAAEGGGAINKDASRVMGVKLLLDAINGRASEAVVPVDHRGGGNLPMKLTSLKIADGELSATLVPLTDRERAELVERLREPYKPPAEP